MRDVWASGPDVPQTTETKDALVRTLRRYSFEAFGHTNPLEDLSESDGVNLFPIGEVHANVLKSFIEPDRIVVPFEEPYTVHFGRTYKIEGKQAITASGICETQEMVYVPIAGEQTTQRWTGGLFRPLLTVGLYGGLPGLRRRALELEVTEYEHAASGEVFQVYKTTQGGKVNLSIGKPDAGFQQLAAPKLLR